MSLDAALTRISQIESAFTAPPVPPSAAGIANGGVEPAASAGVAGAATTATLSPTATPSALSTTAGLPATAFAAQLQQAIAPTASAGASTPAAQQMVQIAEAEVGQSEQPPGSNDSPRIAQYRSATAGAQAGEPWCAYFASWVARQAGEPLGAQGQGLGYVGDIWSWAQQTGRAIPNTPGTTPSPGDLIVFGDHHVGIVEKVLPNGSVQTIEGNYDNQVSRVIRGAGEASGYVRM